MITYHVHELPNIDCRISHQMCHCVEKLRSEATLFIESLLNQRPAGAPLAPPQVAIALLCRVNELAASAEMLVIKQRARDASILILAGYELQLDAMFLGRSAPNIDTWLDHAKENKKPWPVRFLQEQLFSDPHELEAEIDLYRRYSMVKHCNPVGDPFSFPIAVARGVIKLDKGLHKDLSPTHLFMLGTIVARTIRGAVGMVSAFGFDCGETDGRIKILEAELGVILEASVLSMLVDRASQEHESS